MARFSEQESTPSRFLSWATRVTAKRPHSRRRSPLAAWGTVLVSTGVVRELRRRVGSRSLGSDSCSQMVPRGGRCERVAGAVAEPFQVGRAVKT